MGRLAKMLLLWCIPSLAAVVSAVLLPWWVAGAVGVLAAVVWYEVYCMEERP